MVPSKSKRSESRRSSILKSRKPRQPLQNVNFDSSSNENSPAASSKVKRRVSFAEKKHVKEFCHSTEQGTVWDNTYEEHDFSLKRSPLGDQNAEAESKETALYTSNNDSICIYSEKNSDYPNSTYLVNNQLSQKSAARANEENDDASSDLDFTNPVRSTKLFNISQLGSAALPNKPCVSEDAIPSGTVACSDSDEKCVVWPDEESQSRQTVITKTSKNIKSSNITTYRDSDEEGCVDNVTDKYYSESCSHNVNSELDKTRIQDLSMELTAPISVSLLSSHLHAEERKEQDLNESIDNLDTNCANYNNVSMEITEAVPIFTKSVASNLGIFEQVSTILQNCEKPKSDTANAHSMIFPTNLQSNIVFKDISEHTQDINYANESMVLTSVIQPFTDVTDICRINNTASDTSMERLPVPSRMYQKKVNKNIIKRNYPRKDETDKTEIFNDVLMEMTKPVDTIFPNVYNEENFKVDEPISGDDRTMLFNNASMEMTKAVSTKSKQDITDTIICKSLSKESTHSEKDVNIPACFDEGTRILCKSMEITQVVPLHHERMLQVAQSNKGMCDDKNDRTEFFNNVSMEITKPVNVASLNIDKENLKFDESKVSKDDKTMLFHNLSIEMTTAVSTRNQKEITCKSIFEESISGEKDINNSTCFNEGTKLLCKSMEFTEVVPIPLHDEKTCNTTNTPHTTQSTSFSQTLSKTVSLPTENSARIVLQTDALPNEIIQDISMEITAAVPSTLHLTQDAEVHKTENLIISTNDQVQHLVANNNLRNSQKNVTKENFTVSREIVEIQNSQYNELSNIFVIQSSRDNLDHSLNANLEKTSDKKRMSDENEILHSKRVRGSFSLEVQSSQENDVHSLPSTSANCVNNIERNDCFVKDIMDHTELSDLNPLRDSLNEISEYSFLRKSLPYPENSFVELQSIKPPSFVCLDSEEENSSREIQQKLQSSTITNRLIINNVIKCSLINSRENVADDYVAILTEKEESINIENNQIEDCHKSTILDKTEDNQEIDCQANTKTIVNDDRFNKLNCTTKNINEESILSMNKKAVQDINHCTSLIIKEKVIDEDQVDQRECIRKRVNEDVKLQNNIKKKGRFSDEKRQETEKCNDHLEGTGAVIEDQIDPDECRKNLIDEVKGTEQKDECATEELVTAHFSTIKDIRNESLTEQDPFLKLLQKLETHATSGYCIVDYTIYYKNIAKKIIVFGFISNSLLIVTHLSYDFNDFENNLLKEIKIISRISDDADVLIKIVHKLILEKVNTEILTNLYRTHQDILPMLNYISQNVKLAMDFMFDLRRLDDLNLMEIVDDKISFVSRSKRMDIILNVTIKVKPFDKLTPNDINLRCLLGRIKMPKLFWDLFALTLIMTASCLDAEDNVTMTIEMSTLMATLTTSTSIPTITEENALSSSVTVTTQDDGIPKNLSHVSPSPLPSPSPSSLSSFSDTAWECPNITKAGVECSCDFPHTLRCTGDRTALQTISEHLKHSQPDTISLLDVTVTGISVLPAYFLEDVALHGLVVSTGELRHVHENAFTALARPLQALGLPSNLLDSVPTIALSHLVGLDRLDLSHNKLKTLEADSFKGLSNLTYLDLCDNLLSQLSPQVFLTLPALRSLRMRGNHLSVSALSALRDLKRLEELDLSNNRLLGPMGPNLLPQMPKLHFLTVSENGLVNVQQGALMGLRNLTYLSLSHNQIDVLEDHSFKYLSTLTRLDLANNRIVAVSSASLAHLEKLITLDLTHNFLRALTADLIVPLKSLQDLRLDDNDITIVANDVLTSKQRLKRLSLADNPLNCDCTLLEFANWLANSSLVEEDKSSAVCATPPALENGILTQVPPGSLLCGEPTPSMVTREPPTAGAQLSLKEFRYDESTGINLLWHVEQCAERYTCDSLIVYETIGDSEIQTESSPLHCDSRMMRDPCILPVTIPASLHLQLGHKYRYCVVLLVPTVYDDVSLGLGCSDVIVLEKTRVSTEDRYNAKEGDSHSPTSTQTSLDSYSRITGVHVNVSDKSYLHINVLLSRTKDMDLSSTCQLSIFVFDEVTVVHRQRLNCSAASVITDVQVSLPGYYRVCASLDEFINIIVMSSNLADDRERFRCVELVEQGYSKRNVEKSRKTSATSEDTGAMLPAGPGIRNYP
ncbi:PREDICTED: uncharacterized protein LOC105450861 isoform X2 [Wasmannia auropunctata]|uniref:uncharacterized protein LOC105450861 isoform X2 n=1 Tax=Wasmannia auropunctata TaxID=64793 RepID=UPI0005EF5448|nr:PREDICTED: uncharacterized protein LOC105450861 isoform X2 [Wasmannia auropunctata]